MLLCDPDDEDWPVRPLEAELLEDDDPDELEELDDELDDCDGEPLDEDCDPDDPLELGLGNDGGDGMLVGTGVGSDGVGIDELLRQPVLISRQPAAMNVSRVSVRLALMFGVLLIATEHLRSARAACDGASSGATGAKTRYTWQVIKLPLMKM